MEQWPAIQNPSTIRGGILDPFVESEAETGDDFARPRFSVPRQKPSQLSWPAMPTSHYHTLCSFQERVRADCFLWTHPRSGQQWVARFRSDPISETCTGSRPGTFAVDVTLQLIRKA